MIFLFFKCLYNFWYLLCRQYSNVNVSRFRLLARIDHQIYNRIIMIVINIIRLNLKRLNSKQYY
jgi:hypothetical protein